jgi:hypothetical protein
MQVHFSRVSMLTACALHVITAATPATGANWSDTFQLQPDQPMAKRAKIEQDDDEYDS